MTEDEWMASENPQVMLDFLCGNKTSERKLRLVAVACYRRILHLVADQRSVDAVLIAERSIEGTASKEEIRNAARAARQAYDEGVLRNDGIHHTNEALGATYLFIEAQEAVRCAAVYATYAAGDDAVGSVTGCPDAYHLQTSGQTKEQLHQVSLIRDIIGNPFRRVSVDSSWLTTTVVALGQSIYEDGAFDRFPVLADALEEAGCTNADVLGHCRASGPHVRGCWAVDLLLGKE